MASCITPQWAGNTTPQVRLTVTTLSQTDTTATLKWTLEYVTHGYAASTSVAKAFTVKLGGVTVSEGTYNINGRTGTSTIASGSKTFNKGVSSASIAFSVSFGFNLTWSGTYGGTKTASGSIAIAGYTVYSITYNANGGTGAPSKQAKPATVASITLSSTKPTRTGYTFVGWATSSTATSATYQPGGTYSANANATLYAVWSIITYRISYRTNGGTPIPDAQTKEYGKTLVLSSVKPTKDNYNFLGWATTDANVEAGKVEYYPGGNYTKNSAVALRAVWEYAYVKPTIYNFVVSRCFKDGTLSDEGTYMKFSFSWKCTFNVQSCSLSWAAAVNANEPALVDTDENPQNPDVGSTVLILSGTSGTESYILDHEFSADKSYVIIVTVSDSEDFTSSKQVLNGSVIPFDVTYGGTGASFGKPAELDDTVEFGWDAKFNKPVYGKVTGLDKLPEIAANDDFNNVTYRETGCWAVYNNANAETISNMPVQVAGRLEVYASTGEGVRPASWSYLRQKFTPHNIGNAVWERDLKRNTTNVWEYGEWYPTSLTPAAADKVYHNQKVLWTGASFMHTNSDGSLVTINLSEPVSKQANGIVLVFSEYKSGSPYEGFASFFVPKIIVNTSGISSLHSFTMMNNSFGLICSKYLNIYDESISGHANNNSTGTSNGITYANNKYVLRYVYGV